MKKQFCFIKAIPKLLRIAFLIGMALPVSAQQTIIPLYIGAAPGSESWNWQEKEVFVKVPINGNVAYNVSKPSLTVFTPDSSNGTAVIICPGGAMRVLNIETEGSQIARELNKKGITAFLLKYRLVRTFTDDPWQEAVGSLKDTSKENRAKTAEVFTMAGQDLITAITYVRGHAANYKLDAKKIGVIGFSGGANMAVRLARNFTEQTRPDFVGHIYGSRPPDTALRADAPPLFIAIGSDDQLASPRHSVDLYKLWMTNKIPVELHAYTKAGHGLRSSPANTWIHRFGDWLKTLGFTP